MLSNVCMNKKAFIQCDNVILSDLQEGKFLQAMRHAISLAKDLDMRKKNYENSTIPRDWSKTLEETIRFMEERI